MANTIPRLTDDERRLIWQTNRRGKVLPDWKHSASLVSRAGSWLVPYGARGCPNRRQVWQRALSNCQTKACVGNWRQGIRGMPGWAAERLIVVITDRIRVGQDLIVELEQVVARSRKVRRLTATLGRGVDGGFVSLKDRGADGDK